MLNKDLILRNPLRLIGPEGVQIPSEGQFGAVLARAGVGKTAFLVQLALNSLLKGHNVLHISLDDPVKKVVLWYREVLTNIARQYDIGRIDPLWETILPHRFIMTFKVEGFSVPKLEERLNDLTEQGIFVPDMLLLDGFDLDGSKKDALVRLKALAKENHMYAWLAVRTHREETPPQGGMPQSLAKIEELFEVAIQLQPEDDQIHVRALKQGKISSRCPELILDPSTMLIRDRA